MEKRSFINDKLCSVDFVRKVADNLIEFQGQNEERSLLDQGNHIKFFWMILEITQINLKMLQTLGISY